MMNKNIIFMGTPIIATEYLNILIENNFKISGVFTQSPKKKFRGMKISKSPVNSLANEKKIDVFHPQTFDTEIINKLKKMEPDLIIVVAYGKKLPKELLELPKYGCINIHLSILPRWRGAAPVEYALMNGDSETGISIIKLVEELDAGPVIAQEKISIPQNFDKQQVTHSLTEIGKKLLLKTIPDIFNSKTTLKDQDEANITYASKITSENRKINFNNSALSIINHIRAHSPKPGAWFYLNKERIKIFAARAGSNKGHVSTILNNNFEIGCNDGTIEPLILQREGKKIVTKEEFLRGYKLNTEDLINA